jgi:hypothetical protein
MDEVVYEISAKKKNTGKWWGFGRVTKSEQYGSLRIGMRKTPELIELFNDTPDGGYLNFSLFEPKDKKEPRSAAAKSVVDDESGINF